MVESKSLHTVTVPEGAGSELLGRARGLGGELGWDFKDFYLFIFLNRGEGREKNIDVQEKHRLVASRTPPIGALAHNPGMCPDRELNRQPFSLQASAQSPEPHSQG